MKYELSIIWDTGEKTTYPYNTREEAKNGIKNMRLCFGKQIEYTFITEKPENLSENVSQWNKAIEKYGYIN